MKATGIVRRVDELGRIVVPKEIRTTRGIKEGDPMEIFVEGELIILGKYNPGCVICGACDEVTMFFDKPICHKCIATIAKKKDALSA